MKKLFLVLFMAVAAIMTISAQEKAVSLYAEKPGVEQYTDSTAVSAKQIMTLSADKKDYTVDIKVQSNVVRYWFKQDTEKTFLVLMTKQNEKVTVWFKDASAELPQLDWNNAVIKFNNGTAVTLKVASANG